MILICESLLINNVVVVKFHIKQDAGRAKYLFNIGGKRTVKHTGRKLIKLGSL